MHSAELYTSQILCKSRFPETRFNSILSHAQDKLQKCTLKWLMEIRHLQIFAILVRPSIYFLQDKKYVSTTLLSLHQQAKIYVQLNVHKSSITQVR